MRVRIGVRPKREWGNVSPLSRHRVLLRRRSQGQTREPIRNKTRIYMKEGRTQQSHRRRKKAEEEKDRSKTKPRGGEEPCSSSSDGAKERRSVHM